MATCEGYCYDLPMKLPHFVMLWVLVVILGSALIWEIIRRLDK